MTPGQQARSAYHEELPLAETGEFTAECSLADLGVDPQLCAAVTEEGPLCFLDFEATGLSTETDTLIEVVEDPRVSNRLRVLAAQGLGALGDTNAITSLIEAFDSGNPDLQMEAAAALAKLDDPFAVNVLLEGIGSDSASKHRQCK